MEKHEKTVNVNSEEYRKVCQECLARIDKVFSNGFTIVTMITVILTFALSAFINLIISSVWNEIIKSNGLTVLLLGLLHMLLFALPIIIILPFSAKFEDNFKAILSTSAYIRVFYELPSIVSRAKDNNQNLLFAWETVHSDSKLSKVRIASLEYLVLSIASLLFSVAIGIYYSVVLFNSCRICFLFFVSIVVLIIALMIIVVSFIQRKTSTEKLINKHYDAYFNMYLKVAEMLQVMDGEDVDMALDYIFKIKELDDEITRISKNRSMKEIPHLGIN